MAEDARDDFSVFKVILRFTKRKCVFIKCETWMTKHTFKEIKEGLMLSTFTWELEGV